MLKQAWLYFLETLTVTNLSPKGGISINIDNTFPKIATRSPAYIVLRKACSSIY